MGHIKQNGAPSSISTKLISWVKDHVVRAIRKLCSRGFLHLKVKASTPGGVSFELRLLHKKPFRGEENIDNGKRGRRT